MNVHVTSPYGGQGEQVLDRLAAKIAAGNGWTIGDKIDGDAKVNLFWPYLLYKRAPKLTAAWFSHIDEGMPGKPERWQQVAECVDLRLTCAPGYVEGLQKHGATVLVPPALDLDFFTPGPRNDKRPKTVGLSGHVYPSGRKGEHLVKQLARSNLKYELVASGQNWPCRTLSIKRQAVPAFYRSLDVYLCTSLIEGIPMPPLEALACGRPIVIPIGVGMLDLLGEHPGIYRYPAGDYREMVKAIDRALADDTEPDALRAIVEGYTWPACCHAYRVALEDLVEARREPEPEPEPLPEPVVRITGEPQIDRGFYIVAYGQQARDCAQRCIASIHRYMPGYPVCLVSDTDGLAEDVFVAHEEDDIGARCQKTKVYDLAPAEWRYICYLDADTELIADVSYLFRLVEDGWDLAICYNPAQYHLAGQMRRPDNGDELAETFKLMGGDEYLQYNGGVFAFRRNDTMAAFMRGWHNEWQKYGKRDQAAFDRVLYRIPVKVWTLGSEWNTITRYCERDRSSGILHYPTEARRWHGILHERTAASNLKERGVL